MSFFCCTSNILKSVIDLSNVSISVDISMNLIDISNIQIHLDISNNERIVSMSKTEEQTVSKMIHETTHLFADVKETLIDISNNPQHVLNVKEEFLAVDLTQPLLPLDNK